MKLLFNFSTLKSGTDAGTGVMEGKTLRVRLVTDNAYYKPLHDVYRGDTFLYILEVILFNAFNKVLVN